jgi:DNA-binding response OmpR family regulator
MDNPKKLFIVDDETEIVEILKPHFERRGFQVLTCPSGEEAVKSLQEFAPDLILVDYKLKDVMTGLDVIKKLREFNSTTKVIFLTGRLDDDVKKEAENLGVKVFLIKPVLMNTLDEVIQDNLKC